MKELQEHKAKFVLSRSSSGFKHSLKVVTLCAVTGPAGRGSI